MSVKDSAKDMAAKLHLGSHHAIERFGITVGIVAVSFVLIFSSASVSAVTNQSEEMDSTTLYTPSFNTSKTQLAGDVSGIYVNSDRTRSMVLMQFKDPSSVSANAKKYQGFLTGSSLSLADEALKTNVTGQIVVFGSTGYMAMVLDSDTPFQQQILNLTMRANSELVYLPSDSRKVRDDLAGQDTFSEFDQWRLFFNPGASGAKTTTTLDGDKFDAGAVYASLVVSDPEKKIRSAMDEQLGQMQADLSRISEYESRIGEYKAGSDIRPVEVDGMSIIPPTVPKQIAGDVITGTPAEGKTPSTLELKTDWVSPNGFDFNWRSGSVAKGYLDDIVPADGSYVAFLAGKASQPTEGSSGDMRVDDLEWILSDGSDLSKGYESDNKAMQPLFEVRDGLSQAYADYYTHKVDYQVGSYVDLLDLEVDLLNVRSGASTNDGAKALFAY